MQNITDRMCITYHVARFKAIYKIGGLLNCLLQLQNRSLAGTVFPLQSDSQEGSHLWRGKESTRA